VLAEPYGQHLRRVAVPLRDSLHRFLGGGGVHSGQRHGTPVSVGDPIAKASKGVPDPGAVTVHARSPDRDVGQQGLPQAAHLALVRRSRERGRHAGLPYRGGFGHVLQRRSHLRPGLRGLRMVMFG